MAADGGQNNLDFATAVTDCVTVGRSLTAEEGGVIGAYTLTTNGETDHAVAVEVLDFLPNWGIEEIGFHPEFEPDEGTITENKVSFRSEAPPDGTLVVKYGVTLSTSEPVEVVARQQSLDPPRVTELDASDENPDEGEDDASPDPFAAPADGTRDASDETDGDALVFGDERNHSAPSGDPDRDTGEPTADDGPEVGGEASPREDADGATSGDASPVDEGLDAGASLVDDGTDGGVVGAFLAEIERGTVSDAQLAALREVLGAGTPTSVDVRLRYVHARMEEFAAYADALRSLLDEGDVGTAAAVREEIEALRAELEAVREDQRATDERLDAVEASVGDLEAELAAGLEELHAELDAATPSEGDEIEELRNAVNVLARDVEERFEDLWATVDAVNRASEAASVDAIN